MDLRVSGDDGQPTREYVAIAFPVDKAKWNPQLRPVRTYVPPQITSVATGSARVMAAGQTVDGPAGARHDDRHASTDGLDQR